MIHHYIREIVSDIIEQIAEFYNIKVEDITGRCRKREFAEARQVAAYCIHYKLPKLSYTRIGYLLGRKDHSTISYYNKVVREWLDNPKLNNRVVLCVNQVLNISND